MAELGAAVAEPVADASLVDAPDTTLEAPDQPISDAPSADPSDEASTDSFEPDNTDGITPESDDDPDEVITRRNAPKLVQEAREAALKAVEERDNALKAKQDAEAALAAQQKAETALTEEMTAFVGTEDEVQRLRDIITKPIPEVPDADEYDAASMQRQQEAIRAQREAIRERNAAQDTLADYGKRRELLPNMYGRVREGFSAGVRGVFEAVASDTEGVDRALFIDHLDAPNLDPAEMTARLRKAFDHYGEVRQKMGADEWKGKHDAIKKAYDNLKAANGGAGDTPESGGRPGRARIFTRADLAGPDGLKLYREHREEIERQEAAGLIQ